MTSGDERSSGEGEGKTELVKTYVRANVAYKD